MAHRRNVHGCKHLELIGDHGAFPVHMHRTISRQRHFAPCAQNAVVSTIDAVYICTYIQYGACALDTRRLQFNKIISMLMMYIII